RRPLSHASRTRVFENILFRTSAGFRRVCEQVRANLAEPTILAKDNFSCLPLDETHYGATDALGTRTDYLKVNLTDEQGQRRANSRGLHSMRPMRYGMFSHGKLS